MELQEVQNMPAHVFTISVNNEDTSENSIITIPLDSIGPSGENLATIPIENSSKGNQLETISLPQDFSLSKLNMGQKKFKKKVSRNAQCKVCMETFSQSFALREHMRVHTGDKPHTCNICQKTFRHVTNLQRHTEIHTSNKHFDCNLCEKSFRRKAHLIKHQRTIHQVVTISSDPKINPFTQIVCCKKCGKKCKSMKDMRKHWAWHCYAQSSVQNDLLNVERPSVLASTFECEMCREKFQIKVQYDIHLKMVHRKEYCDIRCIDCDQSFVCLKDLSSHLRNEHIISSTDKPGRGINQEEKLSLLRQSSSKTRDSEPNFANGCECVHPFYEVDSLEDLYFLSSLELEAECHLHGVDICGDKIVIVDSLWNHYTRLHCDQIGSLEILEKTSVPM